MRRNAIALFVGVFLIAACGSRLTDEQRAALATDSGSNTADVLDGPGGSNDPDGTTTTTRAKVAGGGSETAGPSDDGTSGPVDGSPDDDGGGVVVVGGSSCGGGADSDVGVSETEIKIGNVSTISGPIPGFGQTGVNAVKAYVNFVNATGGVCGRKLTLVTADDRLQSGTNKSEHDKLSDQVMGFVGGTTVVDDGGAQSINGSNIAYTGLAITDAMISSANNFPTTPLDPASKGNNAAAIFRYLKDVEGVSKAGLIAPAQAAAKARAADYRADFENAGIPVVLDAEVAVTETNYAGVAQNVKNAKVDVLVTTLEITGMSNLARDLQTVGYFPKVPFYGAQAYGRDFLSRAGEAAEPTVLGLAFSILEDAGSVPAINDFLTWYQNTNPGADIDFFAIQSWVAADLYVTALRQVAGEPTRDKVLAQLQGIKDYDANGFIAPITPAAKQGPRCFMIAKVSGGKWVRAHPSSGFECGYA
ncbi:ABC transporter substrate-binding protein [Actinospongicola halichondriae]|uniref:ABC transporter substrate-binding protein n=1 Tax=Actinospongicola halichondriae TaxID=3236844 RepID=UPI003D513BF9